MWHQHPQSSERLLFGIQIPGAKFLLRDCPPRTELGVALRVVDAPGDICPPPCITDNTHGEWVDWCLHMHQEETGLGQC